MRGLRAQGTGRAVSLLIAAVALLSSILAAASLQHTHGGPNPGFFNQEHDLSSLAGLTASGPLPAAPVFGPAPVVRTLIATLLPRLLWRPAVGSPSRAPPSA
jgi:hypothetical protein